MKTFRARGALAVSVMLSALTALAGCGASASSSTGGGAEVVAEGVAEVVAGVLQGGELGGLAAEEQGPASSPDRRRHR
jgi:hypothetical protein